MILAGVTIVALIAGFLLLAVAGRRESWPMACIGIVLLAVGLAPAYLPMLSELPAFANPIPTAQAGTQTLAAVCKEAERMVKKGRAAPTKTPTLVTVERLSERGIYDDVILVYGYPDNYAAAKEIAEYASQKYKRDYRFIPVRP